MLILLYGCTTWTLTKFLENKLDGNYTRMLRAILNKSWWQHPTRHQLYGHLPPITTTIQVRRTSHARHCWKSKDELIRDVLLWTPTYGRAKAGRPARTYIQQLCEDTGCSLEDLPEALNDREEWQERVRDICASGTTWWWWLLWITNNSVKYQSFVYKHLNDQTVLFLAIKFSRAHLFALSLNVESPIWPIDRTLSGATTPGQSEPWSNGNKEGLHIPQSSYMTGTSPSDCLMPCPGHSLLWGGALPLCRDAVSVFYSPSKLGWVSNRSQRNLLAFNNIWNHVIVSHLLVFRIVTRSYNCSHCAGIVSWNLVSAQKKKWLHY